VAVKYSNNASTLLTSGINTSATSVVVDSVASLPALGVGDHMYLTKVSADGIEVMKVTGVSGSTLTCVRGQDGTSAYAGLAGDVIELRLSSAMLTDAIADSNANVFNTLSVAGQTDIAADSASDTLTIAGAGGVSVTTDAATDTVTISSTTGATNGFAIAMSVAL